MPTTTQARIAALRDVNDEDYLDAVEDYVFGDEPAVPADHEVFRSAELVERTHVALTTLIAIARSDAKRAEPGTKARADALNDGAVLAAQRKVLGPIIKTVAEERRRAENRGLQRRAWEELARRYPQEYMAIKRELRAEAEAGQ